MGLECRKAWVALSLCVALAAGASPAVAKPKTSIDLGAQVQARLARGDRAGLLALLDKAAAASRLDAAQWGLLGDLRFDAARAEEAHTAWQKASALSPSEVRWHERLARSAVERGDWASAAASTERILTLRPNSPRAPQYLAALAEFHALAGDFTRAEQSARALVRRDPSGPDGLLALAYVHLQADEDEAAEAVYLDILELHPDNEIALNNLGNIEYMRLDFDAAQSRYEKIVRAEDTSPTARSIALANLAELFQIRGDYASAESLYADAIEARPDAPWGYMGLAATLDVQGDYDAAANAMIDGWSRDRNALSRLNSRFYSPEWAWQRDALIAEVEGEPEVAVELWTQVAQGDVKALVNPAVSHLRALSAPTR